jgi:hypothetical protein
MKNRFIKRSLLAVFITSLIFTFIVGYLAIRNVSSSDSQLMISSQKISKAIIMRFLDQSERMFSSANYTPTPFDSPSTDFEYAKLSHPYFKKIRDDKRVAHFYSQSLGLNSQDTIDFMDAVSMREYLRNLFPHGTSTRNFMRTNLLEMIDAAEQGERFLCGNISKMLVQMIQAGGTQARTVALESLNDGGHIVVEMWSNQLDKWVLIDPDYNVHYTNASGTPLSAIELYTMAQNSHDLKKISRITGKSLNTLHNNETKLVEQFYKNGFSILFYNSWVDKNLPRRNPARSPAIMGAYLGESEINKIYYKHDGNIKDEEFVAVLYKQPPGNEQLTSQSTRTW